MSETTNSAAYELLGDPLSAATRSAKRSMYVFATLCVLIAYTGVVPDQAKVLGFTFPGLTDNVINWALFCLVLFSFISFCAYVSSDYFRYRHMLDRYDAVIAGKLESAIYTHPDDAQEQEYHADNFKEITGYSGYRISEKTTKYLSLFKIFIDFYFPIAYTLSGMIYFLLTRLL